MSNGGMIDPAMRRPPSGSHDGGVGVHVARLDEGGRIAVAQKAEALTEVLRGLHGASLDPIERLRMARHLARVTPGLGLRPEHINLQDVTDGGLAGHIANVAALRRALKAASQARYLGPLHQTKPTQGGVRYIGPAD